MARTTVLVVEDDEAIRRGLIDALACAGFETRSASDGRTGLELALEGTVDLVLLDLMLPALDGRSVLRALRSAHPTLPVILVTARGAERDRVGGLEDGADDYVTKPFSATELLARVRAVLRRSPERPLDLKRLSFDGRVVDLERREVILRSGARRVLSEREAAILRYLAVARGRAVDRGELLHRVWGLDPRGLTTRAVDMHIARLREKLAPEGEAGTASTSAIIKTVRGKGYMLAGDVACDDAHEEVA